MTAPGIIARHAVITPQCREGRGVAGAWDEAVARLRAEYAALQIHANEEAIFHLVLTVERPEAAR